MHLGRNWVETFYYTCKRHLSFSLPSVHQCMWKQKQTAITHQANIQCFFFYFSFLLVLDPYYCFHPKFYQEHFSASTYISRPGCKVDGISQCIFCVILPGDEAEGWYFPSSRTTLDECFIWWWIKLHLLLFLVQSLLRGTFSKDFPCGHQELSIYRSITLKD